MLRLLVVGCPGRLCCCCDVRVLVRVQCASACGVGSWGRERGVAGAGGGWLVVVLVRGELDLFRF